MRPREIDEITISEYEMIVEALDLREVDESFRAHRQAFLNHAARSMKRAGKGKTKPAYTRFEQFFDYEKEMNRARKKEKGISDKFRELDKKLAEEDTDGGGKI